MTAKTVSKTDSKYNVKLIAITAMCAALITVTTAFIKIPSPLGYSHAGDSMIYLAASILPGPFGIIATTIVTIGGYFIANGLMYDFGAAIAELPTCWLQPGVGALIYIVVGIGLDKINFKKKLSL